MIEHVDENCNCPRKWCPCSEQVKCYGAFYRARGRIAGPFMKRTLKGTENSSEPDSSFTLRQWEDLKASYDHTCLRCGRQEPEITLTVDHVVPVAIGGTSDSDIIQSMLFLQQKQRGKDQQLQIIRSNNMHNMYYTVPCLTDEQMPLLKQAEV
jgi:5-methylcytosine-specific restriction endonuclease McrA